MHGHFRHTLATTNWAVTNELSGHRLGAFFIEPDLFDNNVPYDNTTSIYLINLLWKLGIGLGLDLELHYFCIFLRRITKTTTLSSVNFT